MRCPRRSFPSLPAGLLVALLLGACPAEYEPGEVRPTLGVSPVPYVTQGTTLDVAVLLGGTTGTPAASIEVFGQVPGVSAEVSPAQYVSGSTRLILKAARDAPAGQGTLTLQANLASGGSVQSPIPVTVVSGQRSDVNGRLTDAVGAPLAGQTVHLVQDGLTAVTDDQGRFAFPAVLLPYDLAQVGPGRTWVWQDLRSPQPVLADFSRVASSSQGRLRGRISGGLEGPLAPGVVTLVAVSSPLPGLTRGDGPVEAAGPDGLPAFEVEVSWSGSAARQVTLLALQYTVGADGAPLTYHGFGRTQVELAPDRTLDDVEVALAPVDETASIGGRVPVVAALAAPLTLLLDRAGAPGATFRIGPITVPAAADAGVSTPFEVAVPLLPGLQVGVETRLSSGSGQEVLGRAGPLAPGTTGIELAVPPYLQPAQLLVPGAPLGPGGGSGVNVAWLRPAGGRAGEELPDLVILSAQTARMPDLETLGLTWPTAQAEVVLERVTAAQVPLVEPFHGPEPGLIPPGLLDLGILPPDPSQLRAERSSVTSTVAVPGAAQ